MNFRRDRRDTLKQIGAGAGALAMGAAGSALAQQDTIKVAAIYPLSGPTGVLGNGFLTGAKIAAEQINRSGGVLGRKVELVIRDDKASPAESALVAREVLGSGIKFIVGGMLTAPAMAVINLLAENNALFIVTGSQVVGLTHENYNPNVFRATYNARMGLFATAQALAEAYPNITKWGGVTPDNLFGTDNYRTFASAIKSAYKKKGKTIDVADPVLTPFPATDFKVQISRVMSSPIEGLYTGTTATDYYTFMAQAKQLGLYNKIKVFVEAGQGLSIAKGLGANLPKDNLWTPTTWYPYAKDANATSKALSKDYLAMSNEKVVDNNIVHGHTGMMALVNAIKNAQSLEPAVVRVALERVQFESAAGPLSFRKEDHQAFYPTTVLKITQKAGDPGWEVTQAIKVRGEDTIEPATPGQKYVEN